MSADIIGKGKKTFPVSFLISAGFPAERIRAKERRAFSFVFGCADRLPPGCSLQSVSVRSGPSCRISPGAHAPGRKSMKTIGRESFYTLNFPLTGVGGHERSRHEFS